MNVYTGVVTTGSKRASALGYPTANIRLTGEPVSGIYIGSVTTNGTQYPAAIFADPSRELLEAYLVDFSDDLYGKEISITLHEKIRESEMFTDDTALQSAIQKDVTMVREYFKNR